MAADITTGSPPPRRKSALRSPVTWVIVLGIAVAGGAVILWRRSQSSTAAAATTAATDTSTPTDYSGEIATLQSEIADLQSSAAQDAASDATGSTGSTGTGTVKVPDVKGKTVAAADAAILAAGLKPGAHSTQTGTVNGQTPGPGTMVASGSVVDLSVAGTSTGGGGGESGGTAHVPAMPASVHGSAAGPTSIRLTWGAVSGATKYEAHTTYQGKAGPKVTVTGTSATISGLTGNHTYTAHVAACNTAGCSAATNGPVVHTPKG